MGDEWTERIYTDEAEFMEDYWTTVEAALASLPSVDWRPNYVKTWQRKRRSAVLTFALAALFRKGDPSYLSSIDVHLRSADRLVIFRIQPRDMRVDVGSTRREARSVSATGDGGSASKRSARSSHWRW